jgi:hypothetical protein
VVLAVLLGLAISTKSLAGGLPAFLIAFSLALLLGKKLPNFLAAYWHVLCAGALIAVAIPGLYYVPLFLRDPSAWGSVFQGEIYNRLLGEGYHNQQRWDFYLSGIFARRPTFPVSIMVLGAAASAVQLSRSSERTAAHFLLAWIAIPLVLYSSFSSRVPHYIAPVFPPLAIISGRGLAWATEASLSIAFKSSPWKRALVTILILMLLSPMYYLTGLHLYQSIGSISSSGRKLDIERILAETHSTAEGAPTQVLLFDMDNFLSGSGNQVWRFKFYLHTIGDRVRHDSQLEKVQAAIANDDRIWILAPLQHRERLISIRPPCETRSFVHPEGKRSHYRSHELKKGMGAPQFVLVRYRC